MTIYYTALNRIRWSFTHLVPRPWFDYAILFLIACNCITLAMERPSIHHKSIERQFITYSNYIFTIIFTAEMFLKVIAFGVLFGKDAYLNSVWNILDGNLVIVSIVDTVVSLLISNSHGTFGILRV